MDPLGLRPYGLGYTRVYNSLLSIIVLALALSLLFFVAALFSPHDIQVVEVNKSVASWNEEDDREFLRTYQFRVDVGEKELWLHWSDAEAVNYSEQISQMDDLTGYNASFFVFNDNSVSLSTSQEFSEATVPLTDSPVLDVVFNIAKNGTEFGQLPVLRTTNFTLWQQSVIELQCEDHCSTVCLQQNGIWKDKCYTYSVVDTVCIALHREDDAFNFTGGCYGAEGDTRYRGVTPNTTEDFADIKFEVRSEKDPFLRAVAMTNSYGEFAASSAIFGKASLFFLCLFLVLLAVLVIGVNHAKRSGNYIQELDLSVSSYSERSSDSFKL